jgi:hypothetical protein
MGDHDGVEHVGLARIAALAFVILASEAKGSFEVGEVILGAILANLGFQLPIDHLDRVNRRQVRFGF